MRNADGDGDVIMRKAVKKDDADLDVTKQVPTRRKCFCREGK